ncbi:MAG: DUF302 domain-containing protein [Coriobacteriia bacterium]|nr:DUF302 domain-containing protein [Coriobacteriia bacterium]MBN2823065.1 DUF302 domain-containing protein [Coriobacteriia bacterium]
MDFTYKRVGTKDFDDTVEAVQRTVRLHGFNVSRAHDIQATLDSKGFLIQPLTIFEVVAASEARRAERPGDDLVTVCRLHVYVENDAVYVTAIRPTVMSRVLTDHAAHQEALLLEEQVIRLVDDVVGG